MSLFSFLKKKNKDNYSLVFNIGSGSISGGIIKLTEARGVEMTHYEKEAIPFQDEIFIPKHLKSMGATLSLLANKVRSEGLKKIHYGEDESFPIQSIFYIFSSPWSLSQTRTIRIKEAKPFKITDNYLKRVISDQEKQFEKDTSQTGKIIERKIVQMKINGYIVTDLYDKLAKELEISVLYTVVPEEVLAVVEDAVSKVFPVDDIWCHSQSLALFSVIRNLFPQKDDFIYLDISEEVTDISIVKDDILISNASISLGRNDFLRSLAKNLKVTEGVADSMIRMSEREVHDELATLKLSVAMNQAGDKWLEKIFEVLDSLKEKIYVPEQIFLIASADLISLVKDKLQKRDFKVTVVDNKKIRGMAIKDDIIYRLVLMFLDDLYKI
jgi:cell division ATPase FtsA